jgi:hypothetical protein
VDQRSRKWDDLRPFFEIGSLGVLSAAADLLASPPREEARLLGSESEGGRKEGGTRFCSCLTDSSSPQPDLRGHSFVGVRAAFCRLLESSATSSDSSTGRSLAS